MGVIASSLQIELEGPRSIRPKMQRLQCTQPLRPRIAFGAAATWPISSRVAERASQEVMFPAAISRWFPIVRHSGPGSKELELRCQLTHPVVCSQDTEPKPPSALYTSDQIGQPE